MLVVFTNGNSVGEAPIQPRNHISTARVYAQQNYNQFGLLTADKQGDNAVTLRSQLEFIKNPAGSISKKSSQLKA